MCTLVFAVSSLDLLVGVLLHFALKDSGACGLVEAGCFQDVCCVDVVIMATAHHMLLPVDTELEFPNGDLLRVIAVSTFGSESGSGPGDGKHGRLRQSGPFKPHKRRRKRRGSRGAAGDVFHSHCCRWQCRCREPQFLSSSWPTVPGALLNWRSCRVRCGRLRPLDKKCGKVKKGGGSPKTSSMCTRLRGRSRDGCGKVWQAARRG
jgi:hypothetical protein